MCRAAILLLFLVVGLNAQRDKKFFRKDYKYIEDTQSFYKIHTIQRSWNDARLLCEMEGARLFYPQDEAEANAVIAFWNETQPIYSMYIGVSSQIVRGVFETIDGIPITDVYNKWSPGEPNNLDGIENCVEIRRDGSLNDVKCDGSYAFICKKTLPSLQWNIICNMPSLGYTYSALTGKCYKFHLQPRNWTNAYAACSAEQSYLAVIDSQGEADYLQNITAQAPKDKVKGDFMTGVVIIGFHNRYDDGWMTIKGAKLEESGYSDWGLNQPDGGDNEKCGSMLYNGKLNDINCNTKAFFICEHDVDIFSGLFDNRHGNK